MANSDNAACPPPSPPCSLPHTLFRLAIAPCGGPIAAVRDESKLVALGPGGGAGRLVVRLFSASGGELGSVLWERGRLALLGWTPRMQLLLLDDTGKVGG